MPCAFRCEANAAWWAEHGAGEWHARCMMHPRAYVRAGFENTGQNLFYTSEGKVVYYTAGVGIIYQRPPVHHQVGLMSRAHHVCMSLGWLDPSSICMTGGSGAMMSIHL